MSKSRFTKTVIACFLLATTKVYAGAGSKLINNLNDGKQQTVVSYGTSLTARLGWVGQLKHVLNECYPGQAKVMNSGQGAKWSKWGVDNLDKRVIEKKPDTLFIEFAINDAYTPYKTSVKQAQENLENMIDRVLKANPKCEIILMTMNPPVGKHLELRPMIKEYYQMYRDVAKARDFLLIDHYPEWAKILENDPELFKKYVPDDIHPTREGCKAVTTPNIIKALGVEVEQRNVPGMAGAKIEIAGATILCLGDSITEGGKTFSVYRYSLNKKLVDAGYNVTFIGPKSATKGGVTLSHAGYGGKKTSSLDKLFNGIYAAHTADIILIHSAHNSFHHHKPVKGIVANLESIVNKARAVNPKVTILLGQGITSGKLPKYSYIPQLNVEVGKLAKRLHTEQSPVIAVDHATGFDWKTDTTKDKVHPNAQGAEKMASKWFEALEKLPQLKKGSGETTSKK